LKTGGIWSIEIAGHPIPKIPSNLEAKNDNPFNDVTSPKMTSLAVIPATVTESTDQKPETLPLPYVIPNLVPLALYEDDFPLL